MKHILFLALVLGLSVSCEQERLEPVLTTAEGGGTLNTYIAYSINSTDPMGSNVYGRIVFYKTTLDQTLVQVSLYNTIANMEHPAIILSGAIGIEANTMLTLDTIDGNDGQFMSSEFFVISDTSYYDSILTMDSHINIYLSTTDDTIVAAGNLGINTDPVESN